MSNFDYYNHYYDLAKQNFCRLVFNPSFDDELSVNDGLHDIVNDLILGNIGFLLMDIGNCNTTSKIYIESKESEYTVMDIDVIKVFLGITSIKHDHTLVHIEIHIKDNIFFIDHPVLDNSNKVIGYDLKENIPEFIAKNYQFIPFFNMYPFRII